jgi:hypothetical protein
MPIAVAQPELSPTEIRRALLQNGYWPLPIGKGKHPPMQEWQRARADDDTIRQWATDHPRCRSTGILTGGVVAIDIDALDCTVAEKLISRLLDTPDAGLAPCRTGKAPKCMFFFRSEEPQEKAATPVFYVDGKKCQVEVMGVGQQVVTHGLHDETGKPYAWTGGDLASIPLADLPVITPEAIASYIEDATGILAKYGIPDKKTSTTRSPRQAGHTFWTRVNTAALAAPERWVQSLFPSAHREAGTGAWRVTSADLGRPLQEDISIHDSGIQDFGLETGTTPIQLVIDYGGAPTPKDAAFWLCERLGQEPADFGWTIGATFNFRGSKEAPQAANDNVEDPAEAPAALEPAAGLSEELCYPPGAVGEFARWISSCSRFPSPHLSLVSALALTAGLIGRRYKGPTGLRSNLYVVGLAESGFGKDATIRAAEALADSTADGTKVSQHLFADKLRSLPGLAGRLKKAPSCISVIDEFGKFLSLHTGRNVAPHREEITTALMELTGAPQGSWGGQEKAAGTIARIVQPCLTIHGISTPSTFWGALSNGNIEEGLLGRLVVIDAGSDEPRKVRRPSGNIEDVPAALSDRVTDLLGGVGSKFGKGTFHALSADATDRPWPMITADYATGVEEMFESFDDRIRAMRGSLDPQYRPILNRVGENAARLALIVAVGCDHRSPTITKEIQQWANDVAEASFYTLVRGARENIADNERSAEYLRVSRMIARAETEGMTRGVVERRLRGSIDRRRLDDIFDGLQTAGEIRFGKITSESGQTKARWWAAAHFPTEAAA